LDKGTEFVRPAKSINIDKIVLAKEKARSDQKLSRTHADFLWYHRYDCGRPRLEIWTLANETFPSDIPKTQVELYLDATNALVEEETIYRTTSRPTMKKRRLACEARCRLVDIAPGRALEYTWIEDFHKNLLERRKQGKSATLDPEEEETIRLFRQEELDLLWFLHFDLGFPQNSLFREFRSWCDASKRSLRDLLKAHAADV
jgi:hypothetical protein